eukprot:3469709-Pyramimonas_sp.AAC.2
MAEILGGPIRRSPPTTPNPRRSTLCSDWKGCRAGGARPMHSTPATPSRSSALGCAHALWPPQTAGTRCVGHCVGSSPTSPATTPSPGRSTFCPDGRGCRAGARPMHSTPTTPCCSSALGCAHALWPPQTIGTRCVGSSPASPATKPNPRR